MHYTINDIAGLVGLYPETIREYERLGLLQGTVVRGENGYRYYNRLAANRILAVRKLRNIGFSLPEVCTILEDYTLEKYEQGILRNIERMSAELALKQRMLEELRVYHDFVSALPETLYSCRLVQSPAWYLLPYYEKEKLGKDESLKKIMPQWAEHSFFTRNAVAVELDLEKKTAREDAVYISIEEPLAKMLELPCQEKIVSHIPTRTCVECTIERTIDCLVDRSGMDALETFADEHGCGLEKHSMIISMVSFHEKGQGRFFSKLYVPLQEEGLQL